MNKQVVSEPTNWLYNQNNADDRTFCKAVYHANSEEWPECTDAEKTAWERAHRPEEPERDAAPNQIEDVEVVQ